MKIWSSEEVEVGIMSRGMDMRDIGNSIGELADLQEKSSVYPFQWALILAVGYQEIKEAIRVLCDADMLHLDIKEENIFIIDKKGEIRANLIDFGYLKKVETRFVADGEVAVRKSDIDVSSVISGVSKYYGPNKIVESKYYDLVCLARMSIRSLLWMNDSTPEALTEKGLVRKATEYRAFLMQNFTKIFDFETLKTFKKRTLPGMKLVKTPCMLEKTKKN